MSRGDPPHFRFYPRAYEDGAFVASDEACSACGQPCVWKYGGHVYCLPPEPSVCAWCVGDGTLSRVIAEGYGFHDCTFDCDDVSQILADEVNMRTPGFATFNPFVWPVRNGTPLAFVGYGDDERFSANKAVHAAERLAISEYFQEPMREDAVGSGYALIFQELGDGGYVATCDFD